MSLHTNLSGVIALVLCLASQVSSQKAPNMKSRPVGGPTCPILDGIYTSVMRRIFNQGFHKELSTEIELMWTTSVLPGKSGFHSWHIKAGYDKHFDFMTYKKPA